MVAEPITVQDVRANRMIAWLTVERVAYCVLAATAVGVRLWGLGNTPLSPGEAAQALPAAVAIAAGAPDLSGVSPLLYSLQRLTFMLFGATDASARLWPALIGGLSPLLFFFLRDRLTRGGALLAALLWAFSPLAIWSSRLAVGDSLVPPLALAVIAALSGLRREREAPARKTVICASTALGLLVVSGGNAYTLLLGLLLAALLLRVDLHSAWVGFNVNRRTALVAFAIPATLGATFFLLTPSGLAAVVALAGSWLQRVLPGTGEYAAWELVYRLILSEFTVLALGIVGLVWSLKHRNAVGIAAAIVGGIAWVLSVVGRGRHPVDLALVTLTLSLLAGPAVARIIRNVRLWRGERDAWLLAGIGATLLFASLLAFPGAWNTANRADWRGIYLTIFLATSLLFIILWLAYGIWDSWGLVARVLPPVLLVFALGWQLSQMTALSFDRAAWRKTGILHQVAATDLRDLRETLRNVSALKRGGAADAAVDLAWPQRPGDPALALLRWELRNFANLYIGAAVRTEPAPIVIAPVADQTALAAGYSGAEVPILESWRPVALGDFNAILRWVLFREARTLPEEERAILWFDRAQ